MPIFDNELVDSSANRSTNPELSNAPKPVLGSPTIRDVDVSLPTGGTPSGGKFNGMSISELSQIGLAANDTRSFSGPMMMVPRKELLDNQRYGTYVRGVDLENIYGLSQPWYKQLGNGVVKFAGTGLGTFAQSFATIPNTVAAIKNGSFSELSGKDGYESDIDQWIKNFEDKFPNYVTRWERENPYKSMIPFMRGSANFWGDKIIRNLGFTAGAIGGALVQDAAVAYVTGGIGEIPLIANQIGRASLWLNKVMTGTNRLDNVLDTARMLGKSEKAVANLTTLARAAEATKLANGFRYGLTVYGSARTEAAVEARDGYRQVKDELTRQYKAENNGAEPNDAALAEIESYATDAMNMRFGVNLALLTLSNTVQFGSLFKSFTNSAKGVPGTFERSLGDAGRIGLTEGSLDVFEKKAITGTASKIWDVAKPSLKNVLSEGIFEEGGQFATEKGTYDYFTRKYKNLKDPQNAKTWNSLNEVVRSTNFGLAEQFGSSEGIENMLIGGISALITGGISGRIEKALGKVSDDQKLQSAVNILNRYGLTGILQNQYSDTLNSANIAREMEDAAKSGNVFRYKNLKHDQFFNFVASRVPSGLHDVTIEQLNMLKDLDKEEFEKTFGMDFNGSSKKTVTEYVDSLIMKANGIKNSYDSINSTFRNPFVSKINPSTPEEIEENFKYDVFEDWKSNLTYYASIAPDVNDRLANMQEDLYKINSLLSNDVVSSLTNREGLKDLSQSYEEKAKALGEGISDLTPALEKRNIRNQIKTLRTLSERINIALNKGELDIKTFESLLNFELSDGSDQKVIPSEKIAEIYNLGADINALIQLRKNAADSFDNLSSKEGLEKFFNQADEMANEQDAVVEEESKEEEKEEVSGVPETKFVNKAGVTEVPQIEREYQLDASQLAKVNKVADDRYEVTSPSGEVSFFSNKEDADQAAEDINADTEDLKKVKVLDINEDGTVKVEDLKGNIQNISSKLLNGYEKIESAEEKLIKDKAELDKQQAGIEKNSATVDTPPPLTPEELQVLAAAQGKLKSAFKLFISGITPTERPDEPTFIRNSREFLNNAKNFKNRGNLATILVTPNQEEALGLKGLTALSYGTTDASDATNPETGLVAQVFVEQEAGKTYFVNKDGERIGELGKPVDIQQVIFQTMPTPSLYDRSGNPRFRADQMAEAEAASKAWATKRTELFTAPAFPVKAYRFAISRGVAEVNIVDGKYERNQVGGILIPENKIATQEGLLQVVTDGFVVHNGENITFNNGLTVLQYGDTLEIVNNNKLGASKAEAVHLAIKTMMDKFDETKKLDVNLAKYIQNVLFWRKTSKTSGNQIFIDTAGGQIFLGGKRYTTEELDSKKTEIVNQLKDAFHAINNTTLKNSFYENFYEYKVENDKLVEVEWPNYQSYLLSGKDRGADQTPLVTKVAKPTDVIPYSFKQKYATLIDFELPVIQAPAPVAAPKVEDAGKPMIGEFVMDGTTTNTFTGFKTGPIDFTGTVDANGNIAVNVIVNDTITNAAKNTELVNNTIVPALKAGNIFDPVADDLELTAKFVADKLANVELKALQTAPTTPYGTPTGPTVTTSTESQNIEAKKADIEAPKYNPEDTGFPDDEYMRVGVGGAEVEALDDAQIELFKQWAAEKVPTIPYEVLDNLVDTYDNEKAWGVFEKSVAKFYKGAPGTAPYHEIFEAIWKGFLTPEQRQLILDEFRNKKGQFIDRASGKKINYADATDQQAKERMADDFGAFRVGKLPARTLGEKILKFFRNIIEFFKSFVQRPSMKEELFKAIEAGKFKDMTLPASVVDSAPEYMRIPGLTETEVFEFVQDMTARAANYIFGDSKKSLYDLKQITGTEIFNRIKEAYASPKEKKYQTLGEERFNKLVVRTKENLRTLGINFNEEDTIDINDENVTNRDYAPEPFSTDWKKTSAFAIKFVAATLPEVKPTNQKNATSLSLPERVYSSVRGYKLNNFGKIFNTLLDKLSNKTDIPRLEKELTDLATNNGNYVRLYQRIGGKMERGDEQESYVFDFSNFKKPEDWRLFINFYQTFTKQKPDAVVQYIDGTNVYTAPANQFTTSKLLQSEWFENMKMLADDPKSVIKRNKVTKTFDVDKSKLPTAVPKEPQAMVNFLVDLGIGFPLSTYVSLKDSKQKEFAKAVGGIYTYIQKSPSVGTLTGKTLGINPQLSKLANLYIEVTNPSQDTTYFGVENQRIQSYAENNVPSIMENEFNGVDTVEGLKQVRPELNDVFTTNSVTLKKGGNFYNSEGKKIKDLKIGYIQGTKELDGDKGTTTSGLTLGRRFTQEINQNLQGEYYILVPADGSTEWKINLGNHFTYADIVGGRAWGKINKILKGYLIDEVALALDAENRKQIKNVGDKAKQLRFFREILSEKDVKNIEGMIAQGSTQEQIEKYIDENIEDINKSIADFINSTVEETRNILRDNGELAQVKEDQFAYKGLDDDFVTANEINKFKMTSDEVNNLLTFANANYIINNIELHKLIFGDPYEFAIKKGKLDETKRIKSFLSPRRTTFDSPAYNAFLNDEYNKAGDIELSSDDPGYHLHKSFANTITLSDVKLSSDLYPDINEADAASMIMDNTYREVKLKNGQWTTEAENWHQWQMAYTRNKLAAKGEYTYTNDKLQKADAELISKPEPVFVTDVLKPIVSGVKAGENKIDNVLDKFSQMPLYYKAIEGRNLEKLYTKMWKEKIGYVVFESGRKVGATELYNLYNADGTFNEQPFPKEGIVKVPWKAYGIQVETSFENPKDQTRGSQLTKLSSLDLFANGEGSPEAKKAYERNLKALDTLHENAYKNLLNKLGIEDLGDGFRLADPAAIQETLEYELLRREMSENAKDTIKRDENGQFIIPFEASPAYKQIKDILFSMVSKSLISPKMNGGPKVQVPVTLWENAAEGRGLVIKTETGYKKISRQQYNKLSEEDKKKVKLTSDNLKFYTKGDPYIEVLLPHWFRGKFNKKRFPNDEAILKYLNSTEEGKSILRGIGFRIPTQAMSSIETFRVKGFLPQSMGDTIVVPSEITAKAGSDFDIDKMNTYLKSTYIDKNGDIRLVKLQGSEEDTKEFFGKVFDEVLENKKVNKAELLEAAQILSLGLDDPKNLVDRYSNLLDSLLEDVKESTEFENKVIAELERLGDVNLQEKLRDKFVNDMYDRALQNEYYESLEEMITLPENFDRLVAPVDDAGLSDIATELDKIRGEDETAVKGRLLKRSFMTTLRNSFVTAKKWVGIAAVNITGQSLTQKSQVYIDPSTFAGLSAFDRKILRDGVINLPHNKVKINGVEYASISGKLTAEGDQFISDRLSGYATSFVDVAKDPYIMKIIGSNSVVSTFMFLERMGVGENTIWFLNQPIIREYLKYLDSINKKGLFGKKDGEYIRSMFPTRTKATAFDPATLKDNIEKYHSKEGLNDADNAVQQLIFAEFLKYAKMAQFNFKLTQATNYDTTKFRNSDEFNRKKTRTTEAREKNIFSSVDKILNSSFIGKQAELTDFAMSAMGSVIKTESDDYTVITDDVLKPFIDQEFMNGDEFNKVAGKIKASFLDYIIQTQSGLNSEIEALVVGSNSVADQLAQAKQRHPEMKILNELQVTSSDREGGAKSIRLRANLKDAYDENMYVDMMRELKLVEPELYNGLLKVAVLQGVYQSSISIKNIMPIEDYAPLIKKTIDTLSSTENVKNFTKGAFYKNNWKDDTIVPSYIPEFKLAQEGPIAFDENTGVETYLYYSPSFPNLDYFKINGMDRKVLIINDYDAIQHDFIKVPRVIPFGQYGERIDIKTGMSVSNADFARRRAVGDLSLKDVYGYQKVKYANGEPVITAEGKHVYKLANLLGDGQLVSEYYLDSRKSVINNGTVKIDNEVSDADLIKFFGNQEIIEEAVVPSQIEQEVGKIQPEGRPAIDNENQNSCG